MSTWSPAVRIVIGAAVAANVLIPLARRLAGSQPEHVAATMSGAAGPVVHLPSLNLALEDTPAIESPAEAIAAARAEVQEDIQTPGEVVRLITARQVGQWLGNCMPWTGERPHWLVGLETTAQPDWMRMGHGRRNPNLVGVYVVLDANDGELVAFGSLERQGFTDIVTMADERMTIRYETPLPPFEGVPTDQAGPEPGDIIATIEAAPTKEAECRKQFWPQP